MLKIDILKNYHQKNFECIYVKILISKKVLGYLHK